jgi:hypothetical protein
LQNEFYDGPHSRRNKAGYARPDDIGRSLEAGFDAHMAKPAQPGEIERLLWGDNFA